MRLWRKLAYKGIYYCLHPLLRWYRLILSPAKDSARVLLTYKNEIMLVRNIGVKRWSFPGGTLHKNETPEACALRELKEELSISDAEIRYKLGTYQGEHHGTQVSVHVYVAEAPSFRHKKQWEIDRAGWFTLGELPSKLSPATSRRIGDYKNGLRDVITFW